MAGRAYPSVSPLDSNHAPVTVENTIVKDRLLTGFEIQGQKFLPLERRRLLGRLQLEPLDPGVSHRYTLTIPQLTSVYLSVLR